MVTTVNETAVINSSWSRTYNLTQYPNGPAIDLTGMVFEFVVRPNITDTTSPALVQLSSSGSTTQGTITITPTSGIVAVNLTPAATLLLARTNIAAYALWSQPGTSTQTMWVEGEFLVQQVAGP